MFDKEKLTINFFYHKSVNSFNVYITQSQITKKYWNNDNEINDYNLILNNNSIKNVTE